MSQQTLDLALRPGSRPFTLLLGLLAALPALSIDISAPTLLDTGTQFGVPAGWIGLTISLFMLGFAIGQLGAGPLSDRLGRRPVLLVGLVLYTVTALGCTQSNTATALIAWRLLQGVGAGTCAVLAFAIIRDLFSGESARAMRSYVTVVFGLAPVIAPAAGAWVLGIGGWRPVYAVCAAGGFLLLLIVMFRFAESRAPTLSHDVPRASFGYRRLLGIPPFVGLLTVNALSFGAMFAYIARSPQVLMGHLRMSAGAYALFFAGTAAALTAGAWFSGRCASRGISAGRLLNAGLGVAAGVAAVFSVVVAMGALSISTILPLMLLNMFCRGLVAPNAQHLALDPLQDCAGSAAAAVGVAQVAAGAIASAAVAVLLPYVGPMAMAATMAVLALASLGIWLRLGLVDAESDTSSFQL